MTKASKEIGPFKKAASGISKKAAVVASAAASVAGDVVDGAKAAIDGAKAALDEATKKQLAKEVAEYEPAVVVATAQLVGTMAESIISSLGESPLPLTKGNASRVHSAFPVPREQTIIWADAEFDLRPSGIAATEEGIFIKSDAAPISLKPRKGNSEDPTQSRLTFFPWDNFEPSWCAGEGEENLALAVDPAYSERFVASCRSMAKTQEELAQAQVTYELRSIDQSESPTKVAAIEGAAMLSAERAVFTEQKAFVNNPGGHGEMAEEAINKIDRILGHDAQVVGRDNAKDGADRIVDGMLVQTKFYNSARGSLEAAFNPQTGQYRYMAKDGSPMQLEVPKDQYERVLEGFKRKIEQGKVPGVTDPAQAEAIVRKGRLTYKQAVNLTKPGTVESLAYDAATGAVMCTCAFGISFVAAAFSSYRKTGDRDAAAKEGMAAGIQVFGISFAQHIVVSQLSRTGIANTLMAPSQVLVEKLGYKATQTIVNGLRTLSGKGAVSGAAASKQLAKILRSNAVTAAVTFAVFSVPETYRAVSGKMTGAQFAKNMTSLAGSIAGGLGGTVIAGAAAAKVAGAAGTAVAPGVGTAVGIAGGFVGGVAGSAAINAVGGVFHEGDGVAFGRIFNALISSMAVEHMLDDAEIEKLVAKLDKTDPPALKRLMEAYFESDEQERVLRSFLEPVFEGITSERPAFEPPADEEVTQALIELAEQATEEPEG